VNIGSAVADATVVQVWMELEREMATRWGAPNPDVQREFLPDLNKPAHSFKRCRQDHEAFRANVRDTDYFISPSTMINASFLCFYGRFKKKFNIYLWESERSAGASVEGSVSASVRGKEGMADRQGEAWIEK
jgi:hypothetical protein